MCGIFGLFCKNCAPPVTSHETFRQLVYRLSGKQRQRGPDYTGLWLSRTNDVALVHERLRILGVKTGNQPLQSTDGRYILVANGEIYNYMALSKEINEARNEIGNSIYTAKSDCDVIIALYELYGIDLLKKISGMYAFVLYDNVKKVLLVARDPIGIIPLYKGVDKQTGALMFSSEMKCLVERCEQIEPFQPGCYMFGKPSESALTYHRFFSPTWFDAVPDTPVDFVALRHSLEAAVRSHLQCEVNFGALLSGGVDSSLIASIATKTMRERYPDYKLPTYSVGLKNAPDFKYSKMVAKYIGSEHTEVHFTIEQGLDYIRETIFFLESYDVTTIRSSIPMVAMARHIRADGLKMVLSGEGADEILGGYLYFYQAPSPEDFHRETVTRVQNLHLSDCLRANKSTANWGVELRVPFLDAGFVDYAMQIAPKDRMPIRTAKDSRIEKYILRKAFENDYLPDEVLWRQKEQFSDGVGYSWIDQIKEHTSSLVTDKEFERSADLYPHNTPTTKEAFYYRKIFTELFPPKSCAKTVMPWIPRTDWGCAADPSGRAQHVHVAHKLD